MAPGPWRNFGEQALVWPGRNHPLGSDWSPEATNFAVHAPAADAVWVCLFDDEDRETRHPLTERTLGIWHGAVPGVPTGAGYGYRVAGPWEPTLGLRFNAAKLLVDPFARAMCGEVRPEPPLHGFDTEDPARRTRPTRRRTPCAASCWDPTASTGAVTGGRRRRGTTPSCTRCTSRA